MTGFYLGCNTGWKGVNLYLIKGRPLLSLFKIAAPLQLLAIDTRTKSFWEYSSMANTNTVIRVQQRFQ